MAGISHFLESHSLIALDSSCFIYLVEGSPWEKTVKAVFDSVEKGKLTAVTSILSLSETLVMPLRRQQGSIAEQYRSLLLHFPHLQLVPMQAPIAERVAAIRADYRTVRTPDAIQLATALECGAGAFVTNDHRLPKDIIPLICLDEWIA